MSGVELEDHMRDLALATRRHVVQMTSTARSSHVGSALSVTDILAVLYGAVLRVDPRRPSWPERDRTILSKGHAGAALYAVLAETGFFPVPELIGHCSNGSMLSGHVSHIGVPGVDLSTGALGHGLSVGAGMALNGKRHSQDYRTYVILSDGECDEGSVWEAALLAGHHGLGGLVAIVDYNKMQSLGSTFDTLNLEPMAEKWRAFGWDVVETDGHDVAGLHDALDVDRHRQHGRPTCVIAHTIKGRGVGFMENQVLWHYRSPDDRELAIALSELQPAEQASQE